MKQLKKHCHFCHVVVAAGDPNRVEHDGVVAHSGCVIRRQQDVDRVVDQMTEHLRSFGRFEVLGFFIAQKQNGRLNGREALIRHIGVCFSRINQPNLVENSKLVLGKMLLHSF